MPSLAPGARGIHLELDAKLVEVNRAEFREALLQIMERKVHWAWPTFGDGTVPRERLHLHFEQEYATYVRDFPVLVGWAYVQCPIAEVRRDLAENLYEEETGGMIAGKPHPELFLEYPRGLGMDLARFAHDRARTGRARVSRRARRAHAAPRLGAGRGGHDDLPRGHRQRARRARPERAEARRRRRSSSIRSSCTTACRSTRSR